MEGQAVSPPQGLTESQAVELLKQRRAAAKEAQAQPNAAKPVEPKEAPAEEPSAYEGEEEAPEGQAQASEEVNAEVDTEEEPVIRYTVDGKPQTASLKEAKEALASVKHLSRLRNEIVENHKTATQTAQEVQTQRQQMLERLQEVEQLMMSGLPQPQYMQQLLEQGNTAEYLKAQQAHQRFAQIQAYRQQQSAQAKAQEDAMRKQREQAEAAELLKARPDFAKPDYVQKVVSFLNDEYGFDNDTIAQLGARELQIADDARKWNEWNRNKALGIKKAVATAAQPSKAPPATPANMKEFKALQDKARAGGANMADHIALVKLKRQMKG